MKHARLTWLIAALATSVGACIAGDSVWMPAPKPLPPPNGRAFLIDDFESDELPTGTYWEPTADWKAGARIEPEVFEPTPGCGLSSSACMHIRGYSPPDQPPYPSAQVFLKMRPDGKPIDLSALRAVRLWVRGDNLRYRFSLYKEAAKDWAHFAATFRAPQGWTQVELPLEAFVQPESWGTKIPRVFNDVFTLRIAPDAPDTEFDLFVDNVEFVVGEKGAFPFDLDRQRIEEREQSQIATADTKFTTISLASVANRDFEDDKPDDGKGGWTDQGANSLKGFPTGRQIFQGIPFELSSTKGRQCVVLRGQNKQDLPTEVTVPMGGVAGAAVYFLHADAWGDRDNGTYRVRYANGREVTIALHDGEQVFDFWKPGSSRVARTAWIGSNAVRSPIAMSLFAWRNPHPEEPIKEIVASTPGDKAYLMLAGITVASDGPYLVKLQTHPVDDASWYPYEGLDVTKRRGTAIDASRYLDKPAGKHGPLRRDGERFVFSDGTPIRFWGWNLSEDANFPSHREAVWLADAMAQLGANMVRHHLMDAFWIQMFAADRRTLFAGQVDTRTLDPEALDRLCFLMAQLRKRGIYSYLDLMVQKQPFAADGVIDPEGTPKGYKYVGDFADDLLQIQERLAKQLLSHRNPYTGTTIAQDPGVVLMEVTNESSLFYLTDWGVDFSSKHYREVFQRLYNSWLLKKFGSRDVLEKRWSSASGENDKTGLAPDEDPEKGTVRTIEDFSERTRQFERFTSARVRDNWTFLYDTEVRYFARMTKVIRATGYRGLLTGSNHWMQQPIDAFLNATNTDYVDRHDYWQVDTKYENRGSFSLAPMIKDPGGGLIGGLTARRVKGSPLIITEWNDLNPLYASTSNIMLAAYSAFQEWSALQYTFSSSIVDPTDTRCKLEEFNRRCHGHIMALWPSLSIMSVRGDVRPAPEPGHYAPLDDDALYDPRTRAKLPAGLAFVTRTGFEATGNKRTRPSWEGVLAQHVRDGVATSVTGELVADVNTGVMHVDTGRTQAVAGFIGGHAEATTNLRAEIDNAFANVVLTALDGDANVPAARRLLLTVVGNAVNRGTVLDHTKSSFRKIGGRPVVMEAVSGKIRLAGLSGDLAEVKVWRLTQSGVRTAPVAHEITDGSITFSLKKDDRTPYYEIERGGH